MPTSSQDLLARCRGWRRIVRYKQILLCVQAPNEYLLVANSMACSNAQKIPEEVFFWDLREARAGFEPAITVLQTGALPLGDRA